MPPTTQSLAAPTTGSHCVSPSPTDLGDPVPVLKDRGITEANKGDLHALVDVLVSFKDFKKDSKYSIGRKWARQLVAVTSLLNEAVNCMDTPSPSRPATHADLQNAVNDIKSSLASQPTTLFATYASAARGTVSQNCPTPPRPATSPEAQEKEIFISMKNTSKDAPFRRLPVTELTARCNVLLSAHFRDPENGGIDIPNALWSMSRLPNGNIILSFKSKDDAARARVHADDWVKTFDKGATTPQRTFAEVAHNAPASIWADPARMAEAIREIEDTNTDVAAFEFNIANLAWLNGKESRDKTGCGPLMLSLKSKNATNAAIDYNLAIRGVTCSVSIYVPQPPQCFRCQDWGHRATECTGEDRCGRCTGPHATSQHICIHDTPCPNNQRCDKEPPKCTNCKGDHPSWIRSCPAAKAALAAQTCSPAYRSGRYEASTPFTFADALRTGPRQQRHPLAGPPATPLGPSSPTFGFNVIAASSPPASHV